MRHFVRSLPILSRCVTHVKIKIPLEGSRTTYSRLPSQRAYSGARNEMDRVNTTERLVGLRKLMKQRQIDVYSMRPGYRKCAGAMANTYKSYLPKTATSPNTRHLVMLGEVSQCQGQPRQHLIFRQNSYPVSVALPAQLLLVWIRHPLPRMVDISTKQGNSSTTIGSCSSRESKTS